MDEQDLIEDIDRQDIYSYYDCGYDGHEGIDYFDEKGNLHLNVCPLCYYV